MRSSCPLTLADTAYWSNQGIDILWSTSFTVPSEGIRGSSSGQGDIFVDIKDPNGLQVWTYLKHHNGLVDRAFRPGETIEVSVGTRAAVYIQVSTTPGSRP